MKVQEVLQKVRIEDYLNARVCDLSGGQRQRVAIARALVNQPQIILSDEPMGSINSELFKEIMSIIYDYLDKDKIFILVTHDKSLVDENVNKVIKVEDGLLI